MTFEEVYKQVKDYLDYYNTMNEGEYQDAVDYYTIILNALDKAKEKGND